MVRISKVGCLRHRMSELWGEGSARQPSTTRRPPSRDPDVSFVECLSVHLPTRRVRGRLWAELCPSACRVLIFRAVPPILAFFVWSFTIELNIDCVICPIFIQVILARIFSPHKSISEKKCS